MQIVPGDKWISGFANRIRVGFCGEDGLRNDSVARVNVIGEHAVLTAGGEGGIGGPRELKSDLGFGSVTVLFV